MRPPEPARTTARAALAGALALALAGCAEPVLEEAEGVGATVLAAIPLDLTSARYDVYELEAVALRGAPSLTAPVVGEATSDATFEVTAPYLPSAGDDTHLWHEVITESARVAYLPALLPPARLAGHAQGVLALLEPGWTSVARLTSCPAGQAQLGYLQGTVGVFAEASLSSERLATIPRGGTVKIVDDDLEQPLIRIEYAEFPLERGDGRAVITRREGYVARAHVGVSNQCRDWGLDQAALRGATYLAARDVYVALSPEYRRHNISLSMARMDGDVVESGAGFEFCRALKPAQPADVGVADRDGQGCAPGLTFNKFTKQCNTFVHGHSTLNTPIPWGGACGAASSVFRAAFQAGLPIHRHHNHQTFFPELYGVARAPVTHGRGTDAEVFCYAGDFQPQSLEIGNDSAGDLVFVTGTRLMASAEADATYGHLAPTVYAPGSEVHHVFVALLSTAPAADRTVALDPVFPYDPEQHTLRWSRTTTYREPPVAVTYPGEGSIPHDYAGDTLRQEIFFRYQN